MGTRSFGKGVGQHYFRLPNQGRLKLTTFEFFVGNRALSIHNVGVELNVVVREGKVGRFPFIPVEKYTQLQAAIKLLLQE